MPAGEGDPILQLLAGTYFDPDAGALIGAEARAVVIEPSLDGWEADLVRDLGFGPRLVVISDVDTHAALGARVVRALGGAFTVQSIVLGHRPHCDADTAARLIGEVAPGTDAVIAVGSGTLNDLSKLVGHARAIPQAVFATAPSMNGYTSVSASVLDGGVKRSVRTATPVGAFFDLGVIAAAPARLIRAGLGDSAARSTAQADWLLQHLLLDRPYREVPFALLACDEDELMKDPRGLLAGDLAAIRALIRTLVLSGFGMTICNGSYPASQGEHLLAHYLTMVAGLPEALHGEEIAVCTLAMAALQDRVLGLDAPPVVRPSACTCDALIARYGAAIGEVCWRECAPKQLDADAINARLAADWDGLRARIARVTVGEPRLRAVLTAAGVPTEPRDLGWPDAAFADAKRHAHEIRDRYTFLDLAAGASIAW